jgi:hypothetical protein
MVLLETTLGLAKKAEMADYMVALQEAEHITILMPKVERAHKAQLESFGAVVDHSLTTRQTYKITI